MLHVGTLAVIVLVFRRELMRMALSLVTRRYPHYRRLAWLIAVGTAVTAVLGFLFRGLFERFFHDIRIVGAGLLVTGTLLCFARRDGKRDIGKMDSVMVGLMQGIALIPGISRSGATISAGIMRGVRRERAATFSFLLAVPAVAGAAVLRLPEIREIDSIPALLLGTAVAALVGYISLKWLLRIVRKGRLHYFSYYCWLAGLSVLAFSSA
jgi:undecaprenyl-diphosphatase